ncbi:hypothetical protein HFO56_24450 [Rhizobium laguerreae]|uniref:hypothetical protein n=1 Tax=Rhizobium laguerreae TaxID=1076926 RepID=UPI001C9230A5|nr:hypothetical protein [Rhizobium laguerreae]MBY3155482.1 hypothetical protein [Rhizobium laguerreae]
MSRTAADYDYATTPFGRVYFLSEQAEANNRFWKKNAEEEELDRVARYLNGGVDRIAERKETERRRETSRLETCVKELERTISFYDNKPVDRAALEALTKREIRFLAEELDVFEDYASRAELIDVLLKFKALQLRRTAREANIPL